MKTDPYCQGRNL